MPDGICPFADVRILPSTNYTKGYIDRVGFCDHTAGGWFHTLADLSFWLGNGLSVHFGIARDGRIVQLVNIFNTAFAQGRLGSVVTWPYYNNPAKPYRNVNPNYLLISTEHEDITQAGFVPGSEWTPEQYDADLRVKRWCVEEVKRVAGLDMLQYDIESLTGHHMFDGINRRECPGFFWRNEYRQRLFDDLSSQGDNDVGDVFVRKNGLANPEFWHNLRPEDSQGWGARGDFDLPLEAKSIEVEVFLFSGAVDVMDGGAANDKAFYAEGPGVTHGRVLLDAAGNCWLKNLSDNTQIDQLALLGYYT